jgi:hypothetical protein
MDAGTLEKVLYHIHNWFPVGFAQVVDCEIADGELPAPYSSSMLDGQWYRIQGSIMNDGLHRHWVTYPEGEESDLVDETFSGTITLLAIPKPLLSVAEEIDEYIQDTREADRAARSAKFRSESFDGYSYTLRDDSRAKNGSSGLTGWQAAFASDLSPWRKMY